jgi:hypothetical protein
MIHYKSVFKDLTPEQLDGWLQVNKKQLIGSAIFTRNNSITSKIVRWAERLRTGCKGFVPSHTGAIIEYMNDLYIFDVKPLRSRVQLLKDYLLYTDEDYILYLRDFDLDEKMFSLNCIYHIGDWYPFGSAIRSVLTKRQTKNAKHCSEFVLREWQKQGLFPNINAEISPDELLHLVLR